MKATKKKAPQRTFESKLVLDTTNGITIESANDSRRITFHIADGDSIVLVMKPTVARLLLACLEYHEAAHSKTQSEHKIAGGLTKGLQ